MDPLSIASILADQSDFNVQAQIPGLQKIFLIQDSDSYAIFSLLFTSEKTKEAVEKVFKLDPADQKIYEPLSSPHLYISKDTDSDSTRSYGFRVTNKSHEESGNKTAENLLIDLIQKIGMQLFPNEKVSTFCVDYLLA